MSGGGPGVFRCVGRGGVRAWVGGCWRQERKKGRGAGRRRWCWLSFFFHVRCRSRGWRARGRRRRLQSAGYGRPTLLGVCGVVRCCVDGGTIDGGREWVGCRRVRTPGVEHELDVDGEARGLLFSSGGHKNERARGPSNVHLSVQHPLQVYKFCDSIHVHALKRVGWGVDGWHGIPHREHVERDEEEVDDEDDELRHQV